MKDKHGHAYAELLVIQRAQFELWHDKLKFGLICKIEDYCLATNRPAKDETETHRVYRGQDLVQIIMDWPNLKPCYVKLPEVQPLQNPDPEQRILSRNPPRTANDFL